MASPTAESPSHDSSTSVPTAVTTNDAVTAHEPVKSTEEDEVSYTKLAEKELTKLMANKDSTDEQQVADHLLSNDTNASVDVDSTFIQSLSENESVNATIAKESTVDAAPLPKQQAAQENAPESPAPTTPADETKVNAEPAASAVPAAFLVDESSAEIAQSQADEAPVSSFVVDAVQPEPTPSTTNEVNSNPVTPSLSAPSKPVLEEEAEHAAPPPPVVAEKEHDTLSSEVTTEPESKAKEVPSALLTDGPEEPSVHSVPEPTVPEIQSPESTEKDSKVEDESTLSPESKEETVVVEKLTHAEIEIPTLFDTEPTEALPVVDKDEFKEERVSVSTSPTESSELPAVEDDLKPLVKEEGIKEEYSAAETVNDAREAVEKVERGSLDIEPGAPLALFAGQDEPESTTTHEETVPVSVDSEEPSSELINEARHSAEEVKPTAFNIEPSKSSPADKDSEETSLKVEEQSGLISEVALLVGEDTREPTTEHTEDTAPSAEVEEDKPEKDEAKDKSASLDLGKPSSELVDEARDAVADVKPTALNIKHSQPEDAESPVVEESKESPSETAPGAPSGLVSDVVPLVGEDTREPTAAAPIEAAVLAHEEVAEAKPEEKDEQEEKVESTPLDFDKPSSKLVDEARDAVANVKPTGFGIEPSQPSPVAAEHTEISAPVVKEEDKSNAVVETTVQEKEDVLEPEVKEEDVEEPEVKNVEEYSAETVDEARKAVEKIEPGSFNIEPSAPSISPHEEPAPVVEDDKFNEVAPAAVETPLVEEKKDLLEPEVKKEDVEEEYLAETIDEAREAVEKIERGSFNIAPSAPSVPAALFAAHDEPEPVTKEVEVKTEELESKNPFVDPTSPLVEKKEEETVFQEDAPTTPESQGVPIAPVDDFVPEVEAIPEPAKPFASLVDENEAPVKEIEHVDVPAVGEVLSPPVSESLPILDDAVTPAPDAFEETPTSVEDAIPITSTALVEDEEDLKPETSVPKTIAAEDFKVDDGEVPIVGETAAAPEEPSNLVFDDVTPLGGENAREPDAALNSGSTAVESKDLSAVPSAGSETTADAIEEKDVAFDDHGDSQEDSAFVTHVEDNKSPEETATQVELHEESQRVFIATPDELVPEIEAIPEPVQPFSSLVDEREAHTEELEQVNVPAVEEVLSPSASASESVPILEDQVAPAPDAFEETPVSVQDAIPIVSAAVVDDETTAASSADPQDAEPETTSTPEIVEDATTSNDSLAPPSEIERPKSPWTPSYSVIQQGPGTPSSEKELDELEQLPPATEPELQANTDSLRAPTPTDRPRSPWSPSYSVTTQGAATHAEPELDTLEQLPPAVAPVQTAAEEANTAPLVPEVVTPEPNLEIESAPIVPEVVTQEPEVKSAAEPAEVQYENLAPAAETEAEADSKSLRAPSPIDRPKSPWSPSYSVTTQGPGRSEPELETLEQLPPPAAGPAAVEEVAPVEETPIVAPSPQTPPPIHAEIIEPSTLPDLAEDSELPIAAAIAAGTLSFDEPAASLSDVKAEEDVAVENATTEPVVSDSAVVEGVPVQAEIDVGSDEGEIPAAAAFGAGLVGVGALAAGALKLRDEDVPAASSEPPVSFQLDESDSQVEEKSELGPSREHLTPSPRPSEIARPKSPWTPSYAVTTQGPNGTADEAEIEQLEQLPSTEAAPATVNTLAVTPEISRPSSPYTPAYSVTQQGPNTPKDEDLPATQAPAVAEEVPANEVPDASEAEEAKSNIKPLLRVETVDDSAPAAAPEETNSASVYLDAPAQTPSRKRLESTTSSRFFPGGWYASSPKIEQASETAEGVFSPAANGATAAPANTPTSAKPLSPESEEDKKKWCVIM